MKNTLRIILISLLLILVILVALNFILKDFDIFTYLSGISSFTIAILTVFYVLTTSNQLEVTSKQLVEMKKDRELQNQPLPWIENLRFEIEAPRLFYSPPEKKHEFISRYVSFIDLTNLSDCPAVCIDISCNLIIKKVGGEKIFSGTSERIDTLAGKEKYPKNEKDKRINFLFVGDTIGDLYSILRDNIETPKLKVCILYRNILGAYFFIENVYQLFQRADDEDTINKWHTDVVSFETKEKEILEKLVLLKKSNQRDWDIVFDSLKSNYKYEQKKIELHSHSLPGTFKIKNISEEDYNSKIETVFYGRRLKNKTGTKPQCITSGHSQKGISST